jgi:hypothetical protein
VKELDGNGKPREGENWKILTVPGLKPFLGISIYIGLKRQSNMKRY